MMTAAVGIQIGIGIEIYGKSRNSMVISTMRTPLLPLGGVDFLPMVKGGAAPPPVGSLEKEVEK